MTLEIADSKGQLIARIKSDDPVPPIDPRYPDPTLWARPPRVLSASPGHHRFLWDMQYPQVPGMSTGPDADQAVPYNTPSVSTAPWVMPDTYTVRLIARGKALSEPLKIVMDPRVKTPRADLEEQFTVAKSIYDDSMRATAAMHEITVLHDQLKARASQAPIVAAGDSIESKLDAIAGGGGRGGRGGGGGRGGPAGPPNLNTVRLALARIEKQIEDADQAPTEAQVEAWHITAQPLAGLLDQWQHLKQTDLKALNQQLEREHLALLDLNTQKIDRDKLEREELCMARGKKHTAEQIVNLLRQVEVGVANGKTLPQACKEMEIVEQTYYRWRKEYGGLKVDQARRLKELEQENAKLKRLVSELSLEKLVLKDIASGNF